MVETASAELRFPSIVTTVPSREHHISDLLGQCPRHQRFSNRSCRAFWRWLRNVGASADMPTPTISP